MLVRQPGDALANGDGGDQYTGLDRFGRVIDQNWVRTSGSAGGAAAGTSTIRIQYGYDRDGNALFRHDLLFEALDDLYQYDGLNRLASYKRGVLSASTPGGPLDTVATPYGQQSWDLDAQGNWSDFTHDATTTTRTFNAANETTSVSGGTAPTYDANGNTTSKDGKSFVYDAWNRLVAVKSGATTLVSYAYDALRRRIKETKAAGATDVYFTPGGQIAEERFGTTTYQYVHGASGQIVLRDVYVSGALQSSWRLYAQQDANGNVVALVGGSTGTAGDRQEWYWYEPYGAVHVLAGDGSWRSGSYHDWRSYFQGGRLDQTTGLYVFGLRDYDPSSGVWMERDSIGIIADLNLYRFVVNNPVNWTDPTGLQAAFGGVAAPRPGSSVRGEMLLRGDNVVDPTGHAGTPINIYYNPNNLPPGYDISTLMPPLVGMVGIPELSFQLMPTTKPIDQLPLGTVYKSYRIGVDMSEKGPCRPPIIESAGFYLGFSYPKYAGGPPGATTDWKVLTINYTAIKGYEFQKQPSNFNLLYSNILAHELFYHAILGNMHIPLVPFERTPFGRSEANPHVPLPINKGERNRIRSAFGLCPE